MYVCMHICKYNIPIHIYIPRSLLEGVDETIARDLRQHAALQVCISICIYLDIDINR